MQIWINGQLVPENEARVSVFDSGFVLGDGVWEGVRVVGGKPAFLGAHLDRLKEGAKVLMLAGVPDELELREAVATVIESNELVDDAHLRIMLTRGVRREPYQDPRLVHGGPTLVIIPGHHPVTDEILTRPQRLFTVHVRRGAPDVQDPRLNSHSKLNCIMACIQASVAGADEALMLDPDGFVATCNSTHFFIVRDGTVMTSDGRYCLGGITRGHVLSLCRAHGIPCVEKTFSLTDVYAAEEAFTTGTLAGLRPVGEVDGRTIGAGQRGPVSQRLQQLYAELLEREVGA
ncbi:MULTISPECIES: aminotransferase class IV [unclassified Wenzhouxiangella]|uniref:aminotransferase class IV n=1 Tax=unclassified Wenzhouxiangella TaxID=2613841 RepID=UPI000E3299F6|nr:MULTISPECIES: aminotransferase class IV [unclassified Wenzhouxiangella]RFF27449.1 aminotransferase class IV [Wenzhouxiangella sp. 15181]RFP68877.1 aminotransferase class IV [Wenzhouxiangella sp. 15190]